MGGEGFSSTRGLGFSAVGGVGFCLIGGLGFSTMGGVGCSSMYGPGLDGMLCESRMGCEGESAGEVAQERDGPMRRPTIILPVAAPDIFFIAYLKSLASRSSIDRMFRPTDGQQLASGQKRLAGYFLRIPGPG